MRKSTVYLACLAVGGLLLLSFIVVHPMVAESFHQYKMQENSRLVRELRLTDLCLFTEARYTRHPSQADLHSAFQDHPMSFEHYPSGSMVFPPQHLETGQR